MDKSNTHKKTDMKSVKQLMKNEHNEMKKILKNMSVYPFIYELIFLYVHIFILLWKIKLIFSFVIVWEISKNYCTKTWYQECFLIKFLLLWIVVYIAWQNNIWPQIRRWDQFFWKSVNLYVNFTNIHKRRHDILCGIGDIKI